MHAPLAGVRVRVRVAHAETASETGRRRGLGFTGGEVSQMGQAGGVGVGVNCKPIRTGTRARAQWHACAVLLFCCPIPVALACVGRLWTPSRYVLVRAELLL